MPSSHSTNIKLLQLLPNASTEQATNAEAWQTQADFDQKFSS
jgi:hypothetical protein